MGRKTSTVAAWVLALALGGVGAAWGRSYLPEGFTLRSRAGAVLLIFAHPQHLPTSRDDRGPDTADLVAIARQTAGGVPPGTALRGPVVDRRVAGFELIVVDLDYGFAVVGIPYWILAVPTAAALAWALAVRRRHRTRRPGDCRQCGYSLTGNTSGVCPECGTPTRPTGRAP